MLLKRLGNLLLKAVESEARSWISAFVELADSPILEAMLEKGISLREVLKPDEAAKIVKAFIKELEGKVKWIPREVVRGMASSLLSVITAEDVLEVVASVRSDFIEKIASKPESLKVFTDSWNYLKEVALRELDKGGGEGGRGKGRG